MEDMEGLKSFYKGKNVFISGHTGFKGAWLCNILLEFGANITGYALAPEMKPNLYTIVNIDQSINSIIGDIRDLEKLKRAMYEAQPDIVIHMAAQPLVRTSYEKPAYTYETNVMGTVNILEAIRESSSVKSFVNVTTDKVYKNNEWDRGYVETDELNGYDPYSNSKSCSELVTDSYKKSFFENKDIAISTARAGNVIGGGDFAKDRIIPDCIRAALAGETIIVRNPYSVRPYQHVLEPLRAYLMIAQKQFENRTLAGNYNIGPDDKDCITTGELVKLFCGVWGNVRWESKVEKNAVHEAKCLRLNCEKAKNMLGISPQWNVKEAVEATAEWFWAYKTGEDIGMIMKRQIKKVCR